MAIVKVTPTTADKALRDIDWSAIDAMSDDDIARQIGENPDAAPDMAPEIDVFDIRRRTGLSQRAFAQTFGFSVRTLQEWERGAKTPSGPARVLLTVIDREPDAVKRALAPAA